eukprot:scaffold739_cov166-Pinguiococcus_pyrenoidosus.AAC.7
MPLPTGPLLSILRWHIQKSMPSTTLKSIPSRSSIGRPRKLSLDYILDRVMYVLTTGVQWRHLPVKHGSWKTVYHYFRIFTDLRVFENAFRDCSRWYQKVRHRRAGGKRDILVADTSFVKNQYGRDCVGRNPTDRGRKATKVSLLTDGLGVPCHIVFHRANRNDGRTLRHLLNNARRHGTSLEGKTLFADKGYDSQHCRDVARYNGLAYRIPRRGRSQDRQDNSTRVVVEQAFGWFDKFRHRAPSLLGSLLTLTGDFVAILRCLPILCVPLDFKPIQLILQRTEDGWGEMLFVLRQPSA